MEVDGRDVFRRWGFLQAELDPLERLERLPYAELDAVPKEEAQRLRETYCGAIGAEFMHLADPERRDWVAARMEAPDAPVEPETILQDLANAEVFEQFVHKRYVGSKRYSLEGAAALIPLLRSVLSTAATHDAATALIAMSHRGRLNVMAHIVGVPAAHIFAGFEDVDARRFLGGGDVKYHLGATGAYASSSGKLLHIHLVSNPSHLEAVNPVAMGRVRARQERHGPDGRSAVFGITIHGDAAFAGQGIASETLNLMDLPGSRVGGTVHVVVNNLIGFTTEPRSLHSSRYATDVVRRLSVPVFHVNGEDPEAVVRAGRLACDYRFTFGSDVVLDLICFRRHGHSEVDDPSTTQPLLYRKIAGWPRSWESYAAQLGKTAVETEALAAGLEDCLQEALDQGRGMRERPPLRRLPKYWDDYHGGRYNSSLEVETAVPVARIEEIARGLTQAPGDFSVHKKIRKLLDQRLEMGSGRHDVDWATAELLAMGSLLWDGTRVRLSGQDSRRGTFNQRHAVLVDYETGAEYVPLAHLHDQQGRFSLYDSSLSEAAELGFAYGYSRDAPDALVVWEAQFGDFANGAQVILDQFVCAGEDKWDLLSGVVLLLPHGYEGQGPEHSSARVERFLQLAAEDNIQVCQPSTAAQYFHLLRRQSRRRWRKPLVVLTPKGYLRSPSVASGREALTRGRFELILPDVAYSDARRVLVCSGKIAHELRAARQERAVTDTAIVTLEQIYPFPDDELEQLFDAHTRAREFVWVQEEPANMGALAFVRPRLERIADGRRVTAVRRSASASPATGSTKAHAMEQRTLMDLAFTSFGTPTSE